MSLNPRLAVCTGTFDPVHLGHLDVIRRGSRLFDRLIIGVLKSLNFLDDGGRPTQRYFEYLDQTQSERVMADAIRIHGARARARSEALTHLGLTDGGYYLATVHRAENTDEPSRLRAIFDYDQMVLFSDRHNLRHITRTTIKMGWHDSPRALRDRCFDRVRIKVEG